MIYIGYDPRECEAFEVCAFSIKDRSSLPVRRLYTKDMPEYKRDTGEPQSTDFTFSRFFVPYLSNYEGYSIFVDCDFLFLADPQALIDMAMSDPSKAVWVCKHPRYIPNSVSKMDNIAQNQYDKKNWASLMVFNNAHPDCRALNLHTLNDHVPGMDFHQFNWTTEENIGSIPLEWNCLDGYYHLENPKAIHYTDGGPWFEDYQDTFYSDYWIKEFKIMNNSLTEQEKFDRMYINSGVMW